MLQDLISAINNPQILNKYYNKYYNAEFDIFAKYSPAYPTTNEPIRKILQQINPNGKSVLTVIGGNAPLFFNAFGAKKIDSFDISAFAHISYIIKYYMATKAKIQYTQYYKYLIELSDTERIPTTTPAYTQTEPILPPELKTFINYAQCKKYKIIRYTPHTTIQNYTLNKEEYEQIHEIEKQKLILSNITDLPTNLDDTYDIIYLSNIIHYIYSDCLTNTISNLSKHLTQDGVIILDSLPNYYDYSLKELKKLIPNDFNFHHLEQIENRTGYKTELCRILTKKSR